MVPETFMHTTELNGVITQNIIIRILITITISIFIKLESDIYFSVLVCIAGNRIFLTLEMH